MTTPSEKMESEKQTTPTRETSQDIQRKTEAIIRSQRQHAAELQARRSLHKQRRSLGDLEKSASKDTSSASPTLPSPGAKESVELPDLRFSMASDTSEAPERKLSGIAGQLNAERPPPSRGESTRTQMTGRSLPELTRKETKLAQKEAHPWQHLGITLGGPMIALFDLVIPCIIYYTWYNKHHAEWVRDCRNEYPALPTSECPIPFSDLDKDILGYAIICFGFGELWILIARIHRLFFHREDCAPLLSRNRWELDATSWVYGVAMILALVPFVVGSTLVLPHLYLYSPSFIMGFLGLLMFITTFLPFKIPIGINSHASGSGLRPFLYYAAEDFIAVDGLQDREFRIRYNERYETNKMFRQFFFNLTLWWMLGVCVYIGSVSAVIWLVPFHIAFGLSFGVLFSYIAVWAVVSVLWVKYEMRREHRAYEEGAIDA